MVISSVHNFDKLREKTLSQIYHFKGRIINLRVDDVELSDGSTSIREIIEHPGGVCVAAVTPDGKLPFVRQFRYPYMEIVTELPAGKLEKGEDPLEAVKREKVVLSAPADEHEPLCLRHRRFGRKPPR